MISAHLAKNGGRNLRERRTRTRRSREMERVKDGRKARASNLEFASNPRGFVFANKSLPRMPSPILSDCAFHRSSSKLHARAQTYSYVYIPKSHLSSRMGTVISIELKVTRTHEVHIAIPFCDTLRHIIYNMLTIESDEFQLIVNKLCAVCVWKIVCSIRPAVLRKCTGNLISRVSLEVTFRDLRQLHRNFAWNYDVFDRILSGLGDNWTRIR